MADEFALPFSKRRSIAAGRQCSEREVSPKVQDDAVSSLGGPSSERKSHPCVDGASWGTTQGEKATFEFYGSTVRFGPE